MKKQKPNKQCESCYQYGKGTCNAFKCIARNYCDWEDIIKPNNSNDWESRFDKLANELHCNDCERGEQICDGLQDESKQKLKSFISSELQREREKVIEEFAKIIDKSYDKDFGTYDYKQIAGDFISEINSLRKK